jgi:transposase-like protein
MNRSETALFDSKLIEEKLKSVKSLQDLTGKDGVFSHLFRSTIERILKAEQEVHLGYQAYLKPEYDRPENSRNGYSKKQIKTSAGKLEIHVPRDRNGTFEPQFIAKHQTFDPDLEKQIMSLYSKGMSVRDISSYLSDSYGTEVSPTLISSVTSAVLDDVKTWQERGLERMYPIVFLDCIFYKVRHEGKVISKASYTALALNSEGKTEVLGMWIAESEGAHFWLGVLTDLKARGVEDILIACVDGLKGFPEAIATMYPNTVVQKCVVHQIRNSLRYVGSKHTKEFLQDLKLVYKAPTLESAEGHLDALDAKWRSKYPLVVDSWQRNWGELSSYFSFPPDIRTMIYTTNRVESLHRQLRKVTKSKSLFPNDESLKKMLYLAIGEIESKTNCKQNWATIISQLRITFGDRVTLDLNF